MRICLDARYFVASGASSYILNVVPEILRQGRQHEYILVKYSQQKFDFENQFKDVVVVPSGHKFFQLIWVFLVLPFRLNQLKVDIYHPLKMAGCLWKPSQTVITMHSITSDYKGTFPVPWPSRIYNFLYADPFFRRAGRLIAVSDFTRDCLVDAHHVAAEKINVVYHGVDKRFRLLSESEIRPRIEKFSLRRKYLISVGNIFPVKNHVTVVRAFKIISDQYDGDLVIAGSTSHPYSKKVISEIEKLGLQDRVKILGFVPVDDLVALMNGAELLVIPSLTEGACIAMLEAFKCGLPIVASKRGALWDFGKDLALFVDDPYNSREVGGLMKRLMASPEARQEIRERALEKSRHFTWTESAQGHLDSYNILYNEIIVKRAAHRPSGLNLKGLLMAGMGFGIFAAMIGFVDRRALIGILSQSKPLYIVIGFLLSVAQFGVGTLRWDAFLRYKKILVPRKELFSSLAIGSFISNFLPSKYAGDLYRIYIVTKHSGQGYEAAASVLLSRLSGMFVLSSMGVLAGIFYFFVGQNLHLTLLVTFTCSGLTLASLVVFTRRPYELLGRFLAAVHLNFLRAPVEKFHAAVSTYHPDKNFILKVLSISLVSYLNAVLVMYMAPLAIERHVPFFYLVFLIPIVSLVESLPLSISGLGIREGALIYFLMKFGMTYEEAFAVSILNLFFGLSSNAVGGILFFARHVDLKEVTEKENIPAA